MSDSRIDAAYRKRFAGSRLSAERGQRVCPGGVSQPFRQIPPHPPVYQRAEGALKWTDDAVEVLDLCMGHGSLLFGHNHPTIIDAARAQLARGTHFGNICEQEIALAEAIVRRVPSVELVRFAGTGSEAVATALRLARGVTGRDRYIKFEGHYHGWHDQTYLGLREPYRDPHTAGVPDCVRDLAIILPPNDLQAVTRAFTEFDDIAGVIVEPAGGGHGQIPSSTEWLRSLRRLTTMHGAVLVFDEIVSGFRHGPAGYQGLVGLEPDLTTFGKALFGGMPGGAVGGRAEIMLRMEAGAGGFVAHQGSWNGFPLAMAAGLAVLEMTEATSLYEHINNLGERLRAEANTILERRGAGGRVYGRFSHMHFLMRSWPFENEGLIPPAGRHGELANPADKLMSYRRAMLSQGVEAEFANNLSAVHDGGHIDRVLTAFDATIELMLADRLLEST